MAAADKSPKSPAEKPLLPPDERFWKRYSSHFELPLAGATSIFLHGLVVGVLALGGLAFVFRGSVEASRPPEMDVMVVDGGIGIGGPEGGDAGLPGLPGEPGKTDMPGPSGDPGPADGDEPAEPDPFPELPQLSASALDLPAIDNTSDPAADLRKQLQKIGADADKSSQPKAKPKTKAKAAGLAKGGISTKGKGPGGTRNPRGVGGRGGLGKGTGQGAGMGTGGFGRKATDQEIKAWRWQFDLSGSPKDHADKIDRTGLMAAVPDPAGGMPDPKRGPYLFITDLKRRPVALKKDDLSRYADAVKWYNRRPESIQGLAQELKLPFNPPFVVLLLPKDREAKMVAEELRYAQQHGRNPAMIQQTTFDFRLQNGVYEPVAIDQK